MIEHRRDRLDHPRFLGIEQNSERARERDAKEFGRPATEPVIEDNQWVAGFQREGKDGGFSLAEIGGERKCGGACGGAHGDPPEPSQVRQIKSQCPPRLKLLDNGGRHDHPLGERGEKIQPSDLVKILERRGVTDEFRQGGLRG